MDFALTASQESIRDAIGKICSGFDDAYWLKKDKEGGYPADFHRALADAGWLGICIPEEYGGSGLGITDAAIMMRTIAESGAGMSGASAVHMNVFGLNPVAVFVSAFADAEAWSGSRLQGVQDRRLLRRDPEASFGQRHARRL